MSLNRDRIKEVFCAALELAPGDVGSYLDKACAGDDGLRREVESLLGYHDERDLVKQLDSHLLLEALREAGQEPLEAGGNGRYRDLGELGVGGCGHVTSAWDRALRRRIARKKLLRDEPSQRAMLLQEARLLAWLDHPGAVPVYDIDAGELGASYTMRLLEGETLRARMNAQGRLGVPESIRILSRVSETMENAHAKGVLHLDLKPDNLMVLPYGQVCVLDWGVARFHDLDAYQAYLRRFGETETPEVSAYEGVAGTPSYMPAEQASGDPLGPATDIYAAGAILYEMLVGRLPLPTTAVVSPGTAESVQTITPPQAYRADIPDRLDALCVRMLEPAPENRPDGFADVLAELDDLHGVDFGAERVLQPGEVLFREGELGHEAFHILEGAVAVTVDGPSGPTELARRGVGDLIGEMAVVLEAARSATVTAVELTRVAVVDGQVIARTLKSANPLLARMLRSLSARLRQEAERSKR